jgi:hypothetical protein
VVRGVYVPSDPEQLTRGLIRTADGVEIEAVVLGRLLTLMRRHLNLEEPHLWVVYPRSKEEEGLHLQMVGVWEPSTLAESEPSEEPDEGESTGEKAEASDQLPEGDDYVSVRGELIYTRPETGDLVVKVRQQPRPDGSRPVPFKLQLKGEVPLEHLRHFVALNLRPVVVRQAIETVMQVVFLEIALSYLALSDSQPSFTHGDSVRSWADILYLGYQVILDVETGHALALGLGLVGVVALMSLSVTWAVRAR